MCTTTRHARRRAQADSRRLRGRPRRTREHASAATCSLRAMSAAADSCARIASEPLVSCSGCGYGTGCRASGCGCPARGCPWGNVSGKLRRGNRGLLALPASIPPSPMVLGSEASHSWKYLQISTVSRLAAPRQPGDLCRGHLVAGSQRTRVWGTHFASWVRRRVMSTSLSSSCVYTSIAATRRPCEPLHPPLGSPITTLFIAAGILGAREDDGWSAQGVGADVAGEDVVEGSWQATACR